MATAPCARCDKPVYPTEKLSCLDKTWHKGCFSCETCSLKLTMKNYKGYNKLPYCEAHYPTTKFTAVADTPENRRLQKNTANQSNVVYHKKFEEEKGAFQAVADTPEAMRLRKTQEQASDLVYKTAAPPPTRSHFLPPEASGNVDRTFSFESPSESFKQVPSSACGPPFRRGPAPSNGKGPVFVAIYDYHAADWDEVSFCDGDEIVNVRSAGNGWYTGTVVRTGANGMLPSNYVEQQL